MGSPTSDDDPTRPVGPAPGQGGWPPPGQQVGQYPPQGQPGQYPPPVSTAVPGASSPAQDRAAGPVPAAGPPPRPQSRRPATPAGSTRARPAQYPGGQYPPQGPRRRVPGRTPARRRREEERAALIAVVVGWCCSPASPSRWSSPSPGTAATPSPPTRPETTSEAPVVLGPPEPVGDAPRPPRPRRSPPTAPTSSWPPSRRLHRLPAARARRGR